MEWVVSRYQPHNNHKLAKKSHETGFPTTSCNVPRFTTKPMSFLPIVKASQGIHDMTDFDNRNNANQNHHIDADFSDASGADDVDNEAAAPSKRQLSGVAVGAGIAGLVLVGPIVGLVAAGGAAAVATSRGQAGQVARKSGDTVADAGKRLKQFNHKHKVTEKTTRSIIKGCDWVSKRLNKSGGQSTQR